MSDHEKIKSWSRENNSLCLITRKLSRDNEKTTFVMSDYEKIKSWSRENNFCYVWSREN